MKFVATVFLSILGASAALAQESAPHGSAEAGKAMFEKAGCWTCHGHGGVGAGATGPRIGPTALEWEGFIHQIREPANQMVPFPQTILSDQQAADIYAYLKAQKREDVKQIPLLNP
jgi:mono/diheme cytochrome c family protein